MVNRVILIGNLGDDPEIRTLESGVSVAKLRMATNESYKDSNGEWKQLTEWHTIVAWRQLAERAKGLNKGTTLYVEGKLTHRKYQDKDGNDRYVSEVVANYFRLISRPASEQNEYTSEAPATAAVSQPPASSAANSGGDDNANADDLPF